MNHNLIVFCGLLLFATVEILILLYNDRRK
jgi:hypothetical protein